MGIPLTTLDDRGSGAVVADLHFAALAFEGPTMIWQSLFHANAYAWATLPWQSFGNSIFGYAAWNWLIARLPSAT